jgi:cell division protein FtsZ
VLDITIDGARGILFNVTGGTDLSLFEVNEAASIIKQTAHPNVNLIFGAVIDEKMGDEIRITVIATGFDVTEPRPRTARATFSEPVEFPVPAFDKDDLEIPAFLRRRS